MGSHAYGGGSLLGTQVGGGVRLTVLAGSALRVGCVGALRLVRAGGSSDGAVVALGYGAVGEGGVAAWFKDDGGGGA